MKTAKAQSRCECQAVLVAELAEDGTVLRGLVRTAGGATLPAPANALNQSGGYVDVGFLCPCCGRNTLRSFFQGSLMFAESA